MINKLTERLLQNYEIDSETEVVLEVNEDKWTLVDLFVRQYLNNGVDGFGLSNVEEMYNFIIENKEEFIKHNMLSKDGYNNSGNILWDNYRIEWNGIHQEDIYEF